MDTEGLVPANSEDRPRSIPLTPAGIDDITQERLGELEANTRCSPSLLLERAVLALYRSWICDPNDPEASTGSSFKKRWSDEDAHVVLRQLDPKTFRLVEGFRYKPPGEDTYIIVEPDWATDLASIPGPLTWLVPRYGRHSLPVLLHDHLIEDDTDDDQRKRADDIFRDSMNGTRVPFLRRWMMWAGVRLFSQSKRSPAWAWKTFVGLWLLIYLLAWLTLLIPSWSLGFLPSSRGLRFLAVLASPLVLSLVWIIDPYRGMRLRGERYWMGVISGYTALLIAVPSLAVGAALGLYALAELAVYLSLRGRSDKVHPLIIKNPKSKKTSKVPKTPEPCLHNLPEADRTFPPPQGCPRSGSTAS